MTPEQLLAEDGSVRIAPGLHAAWAHQAVSAALRQLQERNGLPPSPFARGLLAALKVASQHTVSPTKPAGDDPANVMLGTAEVATLRGCTPQWVGRLAARGDFPGAHRVGQIWLIPASSVDAFRHEREEAPDGEAAAEDGDPHRRTAKQGQGAGTAP